VGCCHANQRFKSDDVPRSRSIIADNARAVLQRERSSKVGSSSSRVTTATCIWSWNSSMRSLPCDLARFIRGRRGVGSCCRNTLDAECDAIVHVGVPSLLGPVLDRSRRSFLVVRPIFWADFFGGSARPRENRKLVTAESCGRVRLSELVNQGRPRRPSIRPRRLPRLSLIISISRSRTKRLRIFHFVQNVRALD